MYNTNTVVRALSFPIYRGVEQLVARRAHNPKVVGSSPASATKTKTDTHKGVRFFLVESNREYVFRKVSPCIFKLYKI